MIKWVNVRSTAIIKVGYDSSINNMYIDFEDSDPHYTFCGVPESIFEDFVSSDSVGRYYHQNIKDKYDC